MHKPFKDLQKLQPIYKVDEIGNFVWQTSTGEHLRPSEMANSHLLLAVQQIWNAHCPPNLQMSNVRPMRLNHWSKRYTEAAVYALCIELATRPLDPGDLEILRIMRQHARHTWPQHRDLLQ